MARSSRPLIRSGRTVVNADHPLLTRGGAGGARGVHRAGGAV